MSRILVVYGTTEGHTRKIAEFIGAKLGERGHEARVLDSASAEARQVRDECDAVILGGSLHQEKHQSSLAHFVRDNLAWLRGRPVAFFSSSLSMASRDPREHGEAQRLAKQFVDDAGLNAGLVRCFAGALLYTRYDWFKRFVMKAIAGRESGDVDTSKDYEYTDWAEVERFVDEFVALAGAPRG